MTSNSKASDLLAVLGEGVGAGGQQDTDQPRQVGRAHLDRKIVSCKHPSVLHLFLGPLRDC